MWTKIAINFFGIILLAVLQIGFISGLPGWFKYLDLVVISIVFILVLVDFKIALYWSLALGIIMDIYSFTFFGINLFFLVGSLFIANWLLNNFFTNRSLYTFVALELASSIFFKIGIYSASLLESYILQKEVFSLSEFPFWYGEMKSLAMNIVAVAILFYIMSFISKNLKPAFLIKKF